MKSYDKLIMWVNHLLKSIKQTCKHLYTSLFFMHRLAKIVYYYLSLTPVYFPLTEQSVVGRSWSTSGCFCSRGRACEMGFESTSLLSHRYWSVMLSALRYIFISFSTIQQKRRKKATFPATTPVIHFHFWFGTNIRGQCWLIPNSHDESVPQIITFF